MFWLTVLKLSKLLISNNFDEKANDEDNDTNEIGPDRWIIYGIGVDIEDWTSHNRACKCLCGIHKESLDVVSYCTLSHSGLVQIFVEV